MIRKQTIFSCDGCGKEVVMDNQMPTGEHYRWFTLAPLGDHAAVRHMCSKGCVLAMARAITDENRLPMSA